jgi:uncharacterized membrane protein YeaQ/YmgE (transglycosylase-associated protein family)
MGIAAFTVTFSALAAQILAGASAAGLVGRALLGGGFGLIGDVLFGVIAAIVANRVVGYFALFHVGQYGLLRYGLLRYGLLGELILAISGAIVLVEIVHLFTYWRSRARA